LNTARYEAAGGAGTSSDGIIAGGNSGTYSTATEEFTGPGAPVTKTITTS